MAPADPGDDVVQSESLCLFAGSNSAAGDLLASFTLWLALATSVRWTRSSSIRPRGVSLPVDVAPDMLERLENPPSLSSAHLSSASCSVPISDTVDGGPGCAVQSAPGNR